MKNTEQAEIKSASDNAALSSNGTRRRCALLPVLENSSSLSRRGFVSISSDSFETPGRARARAHRTRIGRARVDFHVSTAIILRPRLQYRVTVFRPTGFQLRSRTRNARCRSERKEKIKKKRGVGGGEKDKIARDDATTRYRRNFRCLSAGIKRCGGLFVMRSARVVKF